MLCKDILGIGYVVVIFGWVLVCKFLMYVLIYIILYSCILMLLIVYLFVMNRLIRKRMF